MYIDKICVFQYEINLEIGYHVPLIFCHDLPSTRPHDSAH